MAPLPQAPLQPFDVLDTPPDHPQGQRLGRGEFPPLPQGPDSLDSNAPSRGQSFNGNKHRSPFARCHLTRDRGTRPAVRLRPGVFPGPCHGPLCPGRIHWGRGTRRSVNAKPPISIKITCSTGAVGGAGGGIGAFYWFHRVFLHPCCPKRKNGQRRKFMAYALNFAVVRSGRLALRIRRPTWSGGGAPAFLVGPRHQGSTTA